MLLACNNKSFAITSVYSPPTESLPLQYMTEILKMSKSNVIVGDFSAKHEQWGCSLRNKKGRELEQWLQMNDLAVHNQGMTTSLRSETTIDLIISNEQQFLVQCQPLAYKRSDHIPIMVDFANIPSIKRNNSIPKVNWNLYTAILTILGPEIHDPPQSVYKHPSDWFDFFEKFLVALKLLVTKWQKIKRRRPSISKALRVMLRHMHYLQNRHRRL